MQLNLSYAEVGELLKHLNMYNNPKMPHNVYQLCDAIIESVRAEMYAMPNGYALFRDWCHEYNIYEPW